MDANWYELSVNLEQVVDIQQPETKGTVAPKQSANARRKFYEQRVTQLEERLAAVQTDLDSASREEERMVLERRAEVILGQIDDLKTNLNSL